MNGRGLTALAAALGATAAVADWNGNVSVAARSVDVDGDENTYRQHVNLDDGVYLEELVLRSRNRSRGPDAIELALYGLGGEPHQRVRLSVRDAGRYRFDYRRQRSEYVHVDPFAPFDGAGPDELQRLDFDRVTDRAELQLDLGARAALSLGFDRYRRDGDAATALDVDREEFLLQRDVDERMQSVFATLNYRWDGVTLAVTERYREFDDDGVLRLPGFSQGSDPDGPTALSSFRLAQPVSHEANEHLLQLRARPGGRGEIALDLMRADVDGRHRAREAAMGTTFTGAPLDRDDAGGGGLDRRTDLVKLHGRYPVAERFAVTAAVRHYELDQSATLDFAGDAAATDWRLHNTALELGLETELSADLTARAGWITEARDQRYRSQDPEAPGFDEDTGHDGYFGSLRWRPAAGLALRLKAEEASIDDPFTLTSATDRRTLRLDARYRWNERWSATAVHTRTRRSNDHSDWASRDRQWELRLGYAGPSLLLSLGAVRVEVDREIDAAVSNILRTLVFDIDYSSDATFYDAAATWKAGPRWTVGGNARRYRNEGSISVDRDDASAYAAFAPNPDYRLSLSWRRVDYHQTRRQAYDARLLELGPARTW